MNTPGRARLAAVFAACLIAAPTALAGPDGGGSYSGGATAPSPVVTQPPPSLASPMPTPPLARLDGFHSIPTGSLPSVISVESSGFHWDDAGAGFGAAFGVALLVSGSLLVTRRLRTPRQPGGAA